jgi:hypothetical protein
LSSAVIAVAEPPTPLALATTTVAAAFETLGATGVVVVVDRAVVGGATADGATAGTEADTVVDGAVVAASLATSSGPAAGSVIERKMTKPTMTAIAAAASSTAVVTGAELSPNLGARGR